MSVNNSLSPDLEIPMVSSAQFESLVSAYYSKAVAWVRPMCRQYDRDDLAQLAVINLMKRHERGDVVDEASFVESLKRACAAVSSRALRKERASKRDVRRSVAAESGDFSAFDAAASAAPDPAKQAEALDELDSIYNATDAVGKAVLESMLQCDANQSEAARWCNVSRAQAKRRVAQFRKLATA
jgi:DNA-directed RNA polymerase specialized sigma24 family protein